MQTLEKNFIQISFRGQITLPISIRKQLGVKQGDPMAVSVDDGKIILSPVTMTVVERYSEAQKHEFQESSTMTDGELKQARKSWGI